MKKIISKVIISLLIINLTACGALFYPERINQRHSNEVDIKIAVADGIGLLFFIVPGVIAFAVDYNLGTIYLPARHSKNNLENSIKEVKTEQEIDHAYLESLIENEFGLQVDLDADATVIVEEKNALDEVQLFTPQPQRLAAYAQAL